MSKHTPGSWQYDGSVGVYRDGDTDDISNLVALVYSSDLMGNIAHNARLISAAPDMAEALINAQLQIEYLHDKFKETGTGNAVIAQIEAALKKAGVLPLPPPPVEKE